MVDPINPNDIRVVSTATLNNAGFTAGVGQAFATWSLLAYYDDNEEIQIARVSDNAYFKFHAFYRYRVPPTQNRLYVLPPLLNKPTQKALEPILETYIRDNLASWTDDQYWDFRVDPIPIPIDYALYQSLWNRTRTYSFTP